MLIKPPTQFTSAADIASARDKGQLQQVRNIKLGRNGFRTVIFPSRKNNCGIICESRNEANFALILEQSPKVTRFVEQPFTVRLRVDKRWVRYTPDFFVDYTDKSNKIFEVKPDSWLDSPTSVIKMQEAKNSLGRNGLDFKVVSTSEFGGPQFLNNLQYIYPRIGFVTRGELIKLFEKLQNLGGSITIESLLRNDCAIKIPVILCWLFLYDFRQLHQHALSYKMILNADSTGVRSRLDGSIEALYWKR